MASEIVFVYNPGNSVIKAIDNEETTTVASNGHFTYLNTEYILYNYTTTLVKHSKAGFGEMDVKYFDQMLVLEKTQCIAAINDLANVTQFQLEISSNNKQKLGSHTALVDTLNKIKDNVINSINNNKFNFDPSLKQIIEIMISQIKDCDPQSMIKSLPSITKISKEYDVNTPMTIIISDLIKYIVYHNTFHEAIVNNRGLSVFPDTVFLLTLISVLMNSYSVNIPGSINLCNLQDLLIHSVIEMAYNIITMRLDRELFVHERSLSAKEMKLKYYRNFQILTKNKSIDEVLYVLNTDTKFDKMVKEESVTMYPYIALYTQSDKNRIKICYTECSKNKEIEKTCNNKISWLSPDKFIETLYNFSLSHSKEYSRYNTDLFTEIISKFICEGSTPIVHMNEAETDTNMEMDK